jgi:hypothetical protein
MSKGMGRIERALVAILEARTKVVDTFELAADVYEIPSDAGVTVISEAQLVSVRRALASLTKAGKILRIMRGHNKRTYWANSRYAYSRVRKRLHGADDPLETNDNSESNDGNESAPASGRVCGCWHQLTANKP